MCLINLMPSARTWLYKRHETISCTCEEIHAEMYKQAFVGGTIVCMIYLYMNVVLLQRRAICRLSTSTDIYVNKYLIDRINTDRIFIL